jgi:hypothetical protein
MMPASSLKSLREGLPSGLCVPVGGPLLQDTLPALPVPTCGAQYLCPSEQLQTRVDHATTHNDLYKQPAKSQGRSRIPGQCIERVPVGGPLP